MNAQTSQNPRTVEVTTGDLPLHCPLSADSTWSSHPRVFLPIEEKGEALCPYCGTRYILRGWTGKSSHSH